MAYVKEIFDIYDGYDNDDEKKLDELEDRFIEEGYNMDFQTIVDSFNYLMSFVLAITIMKRNKQLLNYQEIFIKVNDTICQRGYYDVLNMLVLNYCNESVLNELLDNLSYYYNSYNNLLDKTRKRIK